MFVKRIFFCISGLFHKAISESGTALVPWAEAPPGEAKRNAFRLAKFLDCPQTPSELMIKCLRTIHSYDIIETEFKFYVRYIVLYNLFCKSVYNNP